MPWQPLARIAFAVATYPFPASEAADLPLEIGDELYIIEETPDGQWLRGYLVAPPSRLAGLTSVKGQTLEARVFSGIFRFIGPFIYAFSSIFGKRITVLFYFCGQAAYLLHRFLPHFIGPVQEVIIMLRRSCTQEFIYHPAKHWRHLAMYIFLYHHKCLCCLLIVKAGFIF